MNDSSVSGRIACQLYRAMLATRYLGGRPMCESFSADPFQKTIQRIHVINLDRQADRWHRVRRELSRLRDRSGRPLTELARRFSAVDARYQAGPPSSREVLMEYSLADQLFVEPHPALPGGQDTKNQRVEMTRMEVAVALSHIEIWRTVAASEPEYTLVLEDDVYFRRGFARAVDEAWAELTQYAGRGAALDMLYLSYLEARTGAPRVSVSEAVFMPLRGLWQLSGYVLSKKGARRLLELLPVRGPVDLWINHQFETLEVFATRRSVIEQRRDYVSGNSYSILPVLSKVGVLTREKPLLCQPHSLPAPVFALGKRGSGLTSLAMALSMLGYRCCSDISDLPAIERESLFRKKRGRVFDAYVNVGSLESGDYLELAKTYRGARFIITTGAVGEAGELREGCSAEGEWSASIEEDHNDVPREPLADQIRQLSGEVLVLPARHGDKWELLRSFLGCDYPSDPYPVYPDRHQRMLVTHRRAEEVCTATQWLRSDSTPWVAPRDGWRGIALAEDHRTGYSSPSNEVSERFSELDRTLWALREDTFPSNLAIFCPANFSVGSDKVARLTCREEQTSVRAYTSASIRSQRDYLYGRFVAEVRPSNLSGLITGVFLHRNSPRQEIDIELLGKDTTKLLVNVYYNPGSEGARMEYGYRGTPVLIDLGFDASEDFHRYEIEWRATSIRWRVDGRLVHERVNWNPTPIPHLPMEFNVNLWHSRSVELAGRLGVGGLPARTEVRGLEVHG